MSEPKSIASLLENVKKLLQETKPQIIPPYDSPIEDIFASAIVKYLSNDITISKQAKFHTQISDFRTDFLLHHKYTGKKIAIECDGKQYHRNFDREYFRDAILLFEKHVDAIYHFTGGGINFFIDDCLYTMLQWDPHLFNNYANTNIETLASKEIKEQFILRINEFENNKQYIPFDQNFFEHFLEIDYMVETYSDYYRILYLRHSIEKTPFLKKLESTEFLTVKSRSLCLLI